MPPDTRRGPVPPKAPGPQEVSPRRSTTSIITGRADEPDPDQLEEIRARRLLELAGGYIRQALRVPEDLDAFRTVVAETMLENAMLRLDVQRLTDRVDALERKAGVSG